MLKKIGIGLLALVIVFVVIVLMQPAQFTIERSETIAAPRYVTFNIVNNFRRWAEWSPWEKLDPGMQKKHSGAEVGVGSVYEWSGNDQVGAGKMTIVDSLPEKAVAIRLEFLKPFEATNNTRFTFQPEGETSKVTWSMQGTNGFMGKAASLFMDMDKMVGKDFETGLLSLKKLAEREAKEIAKAKKAEQLAVDAAQQRKAEPESAADPAPAP